MKRHGNLWGKIVDIDNIISAHNKAKKGKMHYREVKMVETDIRGYCEKIQSMLISGEYKTSDYSVETRWDGKKHRQIHKLPYYPDRIVQHSLMNIIGEIFYGSLIRDTFQSIPNRGTGDAFKRVKKCVQEKKPGYALKVDVHKFYPSIDNTILKQTVRRKIKCKTTLRLVDDIIDSTEGVPIGNFTSQIFGNIYLSEIDWWVKQQIRPLGYFRYCDDLIIFSNSRKDLLRIKEQLDHRVEEIKLSLKPSWAVYDIEQDGIDFVDYVFYHNHVWVREDIMNRMKSTIQKVHREGVGVDNNLSRLMSYKGWLLRSNLSIFYATLTPRIERQLYSSKE